MMTRVAIVGIGQTKFGELWNLSLRQLGVQAGWAALQDAGIEDDIIDCIYVGNMCGGLMTGQEHVAALISDHLGLENKPSVRIEAACASGGLAVRQAWLAIKSGIVDCALVIGVEKMTDLPADKVQKALMGAGDYEWEGSVGLTFAGLYALMARRYMHDYGLTREQLASVSVAAHAAGANNPYAQFRNPIKIEDVLSSPLVADPLRVLDCSPISDGAAALVICNEKMVKKFKIEKPVWIYGSGHACDTLALHDRLSLNRLNAGILATKQALGQSGFDVNEIDIFEVHDCFTINALLTLEAIGLCQQGEAGKMFENGEFGIDGRWPTNTLGGLKAIGHPVGATGVRQICDLTRQLRGEGWNRVDCKKGLAINVGGIGATAVVHILGVE
jgi:acetyl-CoA C-acetyltransferase